MSAQRLDEAIACVEERGLLRACRRTDDGFAGTACIDGHEVAIRCVLPPAFPRTLPRFHLEPWNALGFIPHVDTHGFVCAVAEEGLVLDHHHPVDIIVAVLERALGVLAGGVSGANRADFTDEFEAYWRQLNASITVTSVLEPGDAVARVMLATPKEGTRWTGPSHPLVARDTTEISAFLNGQPNPQKTTIQNILYVPIEPGTVLVPPRPDEAFWDAERARDAILPYLSEQNRRALQKLARDGLRFYEYVIFRLPRPAGGESLFGIRFEPVGDRHPLLAGGRSRSARPVQVTRWDRGYLVARSGGQRALARRRVLLLGCGCVGGFLAQQLVKAGVLELTVVDKEILEAENTFRHLLGREYWGMPKVDGLKRKLEDETPYARVRPVHADVDQALTDGTLRLADYDLVVSALGNPTLDLWLNEQTHAVSGNPPILFAWVEPLGLGGHVLLAHQGSEGGCFSCLYTTPTGCDLDNAAAFAAPGQFFARALSGCGSLHTPYGAQDALQTVVLASRLATQLLMGEMMGNRINSWRGDPTAFRAAGFRTSARFHLLSAPLTLAGSELRSPHCRVCGARRA